MADSRGGGIMGETDQSEASIVAATWGPLIVATKRDRRLQYQGLQRHLQAHAAPEQKLPSRRPAPAPSVCLPLAFTFADAQAWPPFFLPPKPTAPVPATAPTTIAVVRISSQGRFSSRGTSVIPQVRQYSSGLAEGVLDGAPGMHVLVLVQAPGAAR